MPTKAAKSPYDVHPGIKMIQNWVDTLKAKTGRDIDEWVALVQKSGPPTHKARREWLKAQYGVGSNAAWWIADRAEGKGLEDGDPEAYLRAAAGYVEAMYAGPKSALRPLHDRILTMGRKLGKDVKVCPCQTIVPLYRNHVFAQLKPTTRTRIDLGLALGKYEGELPERLIDTGGKEKKDRLTHRIVITKLEEIDGEMTDWLKAAYDLDG